MVQKSHMWLTSHRLAMSAVKSMLLAMLLNEQQLKRDQGFQMGIKIKF
jgi:hypothetical protein